MSTAFVHVVFKWESKGDSSPLHDIFMMYYVIFPNNNLFVIKFATVQYGMIFIVLGIGHNLTLNFDISF